MVENKGHQFIYNDAIEPKISKINSECDDIIDEKPTNELYNELVNCALIPPLEYMKLCKFKEQNKATREKKLKNMNYAVYWV